MQIMKWSAIAFAVAAASTQMAVASQQDNAQGFIEDSKLQLDSRMFYFNRDFVQFVILTIYFYQIILREKSSFT